MEKSDIKKNSLVRFLVNLDGRRDPQIKRLMARRDVRSNKLYVRYGMWLAVLSFISYGLFDHLLFPDVGKTLWYSRIAFGVFFIAIFELAHFYHARLLILQMLAAVAVATGSVVWLMLAMATNESVGFAIFSVYGAIFILGTNLYFRFPFKLSVVASMLITIFYSASPFGNSALDFWLQATLSFFFVNCFVLSIYLSWRMDVARYHKFKETIATKQRARQALTKHRQMEVIADTDPLTGLANRRAIEKNLAEIENGSFSNDVSVGVILMDADFFKNFNDLLGHQAGDNCLRSIADALATVASDNHSLVGRYGGEEFIAICQITSQEQLSNIASQFCASIEALKIGHPGRPDKRLFVTISAGACMAKMGSDTALSNLIDQADHALYQAKSSGRSTFRVYNEAFDADEISNFQILKTIESAIAQQRVAAAYQPIINVSDKRLFAHEALMRLRDSSGNPISPEFFIPVAEKSGDIVGMGRWIIEQTCSDMAEGLLGDLCSINVSIEQLRSPSFPLFVMSAIARHNIMPQNIALELTENNDMVGDHSILTAIDQLREGGVQIWLDDFGTGYSGLHWLRECRFDILKIDKIYLQDVDQYRGFTLLSDMVDLAKNRNIKVLVEGVETQAHFDVLKSIGVDYAQGYLFGKPERAENLSALPLAKVG